MSNPKDEMVHKLTLLDTASFRCRGRCQTGRYTKEPNRYRSKLAELYHQLTHEQLTSLYNLKKGWI